MSIGAAGGMVKASTGYAFSRIQRDSADIADIAESLVRHGHPFATHAARPRFRLLDAILLEVLDRDPTQLELAFARLFSRNPAAVVALAETIPRRRTNRRPFADKPIPYGTMVELAAAAAAEQSTLVAVNPALRDGVLSLTRTADNRMRTDPRYRTELAAWTTPGGVGRRDGVPRQAFGPRDLDAALPLRDFAPWATVRPRPRGARWCDPSGSQGPSAVTFGPG